MKKMMIKMKMSEEAGSKQNVEKEEKNPCYSGSWPQLMKRPKWSLHTEAPSRTQKKGLGLTVISGLIVLGTLCVFKGFSQLCYFMFFSLLKSRRWGKVGPGERRGPHSLPAIWVRRV